MRAAAAWSSASCSVPPPRRPPAGRAPSARSRSSGVDRVAAREHHGALDGVLQLADVPRPRVREKRGLRLGREGEPPARLGAVAREEVPRERQDVLAPLAQRRELDRDDVQAEVEVLAEAARGHLVAEDAVRRGDDAHVDRARLASAHAEHLALLEDAQELRLDVRAHLADLVEEERAAVGALEAAGPRRDGAGEGALLVAEELALEHALGEGLQLTATKGWPTRSLQ